MELKLRSGRDTRAQGWEPGCLAPCREGGLAEGRRVESGRGRFRLCVGRSRRQRWPCVFGKEWERREGKAFISRDLALPLAPGTFLSTESWEGWRSGNGI